MWFKATEEPAVVTSSALTCLEEPIKDKKKVGKKLFKGAVGAVRLAKKGARRMKKRKDKKQPIDELKVSVIRWK